MIGLAQGTRKNEYRKFSFDVTVFTDKEEFNSCKRYNSIAWTYIAIGV